MSRSRKQRKPADIAIGKRIRHARLLLGIATQKELAEMLGVSRGAVSNWEMGQGINTTHLQLIAALGVSFDWLATGRGPVGAGPAPPVRPDVKAAADVLAPYLSKWHRDGLEDVAAACLAAADKARQEGK